MTSQPEIGDLPSTFRLRRRTPGSFVLVPCPRLGRSIRCQGQLEAAAAVVLSACPVVASLREQPLTVWYAWRKTSHAVQFQLLDERPAKRREQDCRFSYVVPDFLVAMQDGCQRLIEVKPSRKLGHPDVRRKLAVAAAFAAARGWSFHALTERELFRGPLLANLRLLARYRATAHQARLLKRLTDRVADRPQRAGELAANSGELAQTATIRAALFHLLASGRLDCDPRTAALDDNTLVSPGGTILWDPFDSVWAPSGCSTDAPSGSSGNLRPTASSPAT